MYVLMQGGISNGMPIVLRVAYKPPATIGKARLEHTCIHTDTQIYTHTNTERERERGHVYCRRRHSDGGCSMAVPRKGHASRRRNWLSWKTLYAPVLLEAVS